MNWNFKINFSTIFLVRIVISNKTITLVTFGFLISSAFFFYHILLMTDFRFL
jgi:hypothetical protein